MVATELTMAFSSIKGALELIKLISESRKDSIVKEKTIELRNTIMDIQMSFTELYEKYSTLLQENNGLKENIMQISEWKQTESQYELINVSAGNFAYIPNDTHPNPNPFHCLCTNCYEKRKKSILQLKRQLSSTASNYFCPECGMIILILSKNIPNHQPNPQQSTIGRITR